MSQTSYSINQGTGVSGQPAFADAGYSLTFNNPVDEIKFGRAVAKVSGDDNGCALPTASTDVLLGIAGRNVATTDNLWTAKSAVAVGRRGAWYVELEQAVTPDDAVYVRFASGAGGSELGIFRKDADTATAMLLPTAKYLTSGSAGDVAVVEINLE